MALSAPQRVAARLGDALDDALGEASPIQTLFGFEEKSGAARGLLPRITDEGITLDQYIREGRFQRSLAVIAGLSSVLAGLEVLIEHYRGSYNQRIMYSPIVLSPILAVAGVWGAANRTVARTLLPAVSAVTMLDGLVGFIFHIRGVNRKPGGWRIPVINVTMGPPVLAPLLFGVSGFLGLIASLLRREDDPVPRRGPIPTPLLGPKLSSPRVGGWLRWLPKPLRSEGLVVTQDVREGRFQQGLAIATALLGLFNGVESLYSHYKDNFRYKAQWTPVILTPLILFAGFGAAANRTLAKTVLPVVSALALVDGGIGFLYHLRGILRQPGGLDRDRLLWNVTYGPPAFAPLLFSATGFLGLLASLLRRSQK